jgi:putative membrane protein
MSANPRKPFAIRLEPEQEGQPARRAVSITLEPDAFAVPVTVESAPVVTAARGFSVWTKMLFSAVTGLIGLAISVAIWRLIDDLFAAHAWLGWAGVVFAAMFAFAVTVLVGRELRAIFRLRAADTLRADALAAFEADDGARAKIVVARLMSMQTSDATTAAARASMSEPMEAIIDGRGLLTLADRRLLEPRDELAKAAIASAAKRVSMVTAISPRALVDVLFVGAQSVMLMRRIADIYGARPGALGFWRLGRRILAHLAITGGVAMTDSVLSQLVGHGVAAKLSAKMGEGVLNGLLTARVGLAVITVCRPLPFLAGSEPRLQDVAGEIISNPFGKTV